MRQARGDAGNDKVTVLGGDLTNIPEVKISGPTESYERGDAREKNKSSQKLEEEANATIKYYRVTKGGSFSDPFTRSRTEMKEGKEFDSRQYDVRVLQRAGIRLERIEGRSTEPSEEGFIE